MAELIRRRVEALYEERHQGHDEASIVDEVLAQPDIAFLLESLWDDESGKSIFEASCERVREEVIRNLRARRLGA